jgi:rhodanese-related sulfurtransferase
MEEALRNQAVIVDVRDRERFRQGHIPMAVNVPLADIKAGRIGLPKNKTILVYCATGGASTMAAKLLTERGYQVINTVGGLNEYQGALTRQK